VLASFPSRVEMARILKGALDRGWEHST